MFYRLEFRNLIQKWLSFANCKLPLMKWIEINLVTWMNQSLYSLHFVEFFVFFDLFFCSGMLLIAICYMSNWTVVAYIYLFIPNGVSILFTEIVGIYFFKKYGLSTDTFIYWKVLMHMLKLWTFGRTNLWLENVWYTINITIQGVLRIIDVIIEYLTVNWISGKLVKNWCIASFHWELSRDCF